MSYYFSSTSTFVGILFCFLQASPVLARDLSLDISAQVPHDFNLDKKNRPIDISLTDKNIATYAWNTFFALNLPAFPIDSRERGTPDPSKRFGDAGPTVWNTFKQKRELYRIIST